MFVVLNSLHLFRRHECVSHRLLLEVEVLEVNLTLLHVWLKRWLDLLSFEVLYVQILEPGVRQNLMNVILGTQSGSWVF